MGRFGSASRGKTGITYVPADFVKDATFLFANGESLLIRIDEERLIIDVTKPTLEAVGFETHALDFLSSYIKDVNVSCIQFRYIDNPPAWLIVLECPTGLKVL